MTLNPRKPNEHDGKTPWIRWQNLLEVGKVKDGEIGIWIVSINPNQGGVTPKDEWVPAEDVINILKPHVFG